MQRKQKNPKVLEGKFVVDTSAIINKKLTKLTKKGLKGTLLIPNAAVAELENLANKGRDYGIKGLEELAKLHHFKNIGIKFIGPRPTEHQIRFAKSGEIDALIRSLANTYKAKLITSDIVQGKSAKAYGIEVYFIKQRFVKPKKKKFTLFKKKPVIKRKKRRV